LRLDVRSAAGLAVLTGAIGALGCLLRRWIARAELLGAVEGLGESTLSVLLAIAGSLMLAALVARFLGRRTGVLSGVALAGLAGNLASQVQDGHQVGQLLCLTALAAFAMENLPGRWPLCRRRLLHVVPFACAGVSVWLVGPPGLVAMLGICALYLGQASDSTGGRLFLQPLGLGIAALCLVVWGMGTAGWLEPIVPAGAMPRLIMPEDMSAVWWGLVRSAKWLGWATLPWTPLVAGAVLLGWRSGHHHSLFWRLVGCWTVVPLGVAVLLPGHARHLLSWSLPPVAIIAGAGLQGCWVRLRRAFLGLRCFGSGVQKGRTSGRSLSIDESPAACAQPGAPRVPLPALGRRCPSTDGAGARVHICD